MPEGSIAKKKIKYNIFFSLFLYEPQSVSNEFWRFMNISDAISVYRPTFLFSTRTQQQQDSCQANWGSYGQRDREFQHKFCRNQHRFCKNLHNFCKKGCGEVLAAYGSTMCLEQCETLHQLYRTYVRKYKIKNEPFSRLSV